MLRTVQIFCLFGILSGQCSEYVRQKVGGKIIGGMPVDIRMRPFMLSLHGRTGFRCGASVISRTWGITALHCFNSMNSDEYHVRAGSNKVYSGGARHQIKNIYAYSNSSLSIGYAKVILHDVALFEVAPAFRFSKKVQAARLPRENSVAPVELYVCGWGINDMKNKGRANNVLMGVNVPRVSHEDCIQAAVEYEFLVKEDRHLCYGEAGKDSCYGDSGGPLITRRTIYGIVSFGINCGDIPGIYAKVSYYRKWIHNITNL